MTDGAAIAPTRPWSVAGMLACLGAATAAALMLSGCGGGTASAPAAHRSPATATTGPAPAAADAAGRFRSPRTVAAVPVPVRLRIPSIGVDTPLEQVGLDADGTIAAPRRFQDGAWYRGAPAPGSLVPPSCSGMSTPSAGLLSSTGSRRSGPVPRCWSSAPTEAQRASG
jgi:hypothetical protein